MTLYTIVVVGILFVIISGAFTWRFIENNSKYHVEPQEQYGSEYCYEENTAEEVEKQHQMLEAVPIPNEKEADDGVMIPGQQSITQMDHTNVDLIQHTLEPEEVELTDLPQSAQPQGLSEMEARIAEMEAKLAAQEAANQAEIDVARYEAE